MKSESSGQIGAEHVENFGQFSGVLQSAGTEAS